MDPSLVSRILMSMRNGGQMQQPVNGSMPVAPTPTQPGLDQAYSQPMTPPMQQNPSIPMQYDPLLEQQAQGMNNQLEPIVQQIMQHLGLLGMIRNRSNQSMTQG